MLPPCVSIKRPASSTKSLVLSNNELSSGIASWIFLSATLKEVTDSFTTVPTVKFPSILKSPENLPSPLTSSVFDGVTFKIPNLLLSASQYCAAYDPTLFFKLNL